MDYVVQRLIDCADRDTHDAVAVPVEALSLQLIGVVFMEGPVNLDGEAR